MPTPQTPWANRIVSHSEEPPDKLIANAQDLLGPALGVDRLEGRTLLEIVVVDVEALVQPEAGVDRERGPAGQAGHG